MDKAPDKEKETKKKDKKVTKKKKELIIIPKEVCFEVNFD